MPTLSPMAAFLAPACNAISSDLQCKLGGWLHILYFLAAVLAIVLLLITAAAVYLYRQNKKAEIHPE